MYIVTELCSGGDLEHLLEVRPRATQVTNTFVQHSAGLIIAHEY